MVTVAQAEKIILREARDYGLEQVPFQEALGRVLAEDLFADRDLPPTDRATMDGIAIQYAAFASGCRSFKIKATIAAGDPPVNIENPEECMEIMTGASLPVSVDTVVRYEDLKIDNGAALICTDAIKNGQNLHRRGQDKTAGSLIVKAHQKITPALIGILASVGKSEVMVKRVPRIVVISTGGELIAVDEQPTPHQVRRSNSYTVKAVLQQHGICAAVRHIPDDPEITGRELETCLANYDVIILSGGVSMGKFDYVPGALAALGVDKLFHKVQQRPGKPFWFGRSQGAGQNNGKLVFAFPGNPVSTFLCLHRYFLPWLGLQLGAFGNSSNCYAILDENVTFTLPMQYFMQVKLKFNERGQVLALPVEGNGSGDFSNLTDSDAFMELPLERDEFKRGDVFPVWRFK